MALRLPALMRTTAARLSALYFILFALCAVMLVFYMTSLSASMLKAQTQETINEEVQGLDRAYRRGGLPFLVRVVEQRSRQPGANLYLIADANGRILTGNVESLDPGILEIEGWTERPFTYQRYGEGTLDRRLLDGARDPLAVAGHQEVEEGPLAGRPLDQGLVHRIDAGPLIGRDQGVHLAGDFLVGAPRRLAGGGDIDIGQEGAGRGPEQGQEQQGQPEGRGAENARQAHADAP